MSTASRWRVLVVLMTGVLAFAPARADAAGETGPYGFGRPATPDEIAAVDIDVRFDGAGLPPGRGTPAEGAALYAESCVACHSEDLKGVKAAGTGGLVGPGMTVQRHWPYAPTLFDYIRRSMPFHEPASLNDDQVYALTAYILAEAGIVPKDAAMDAAALSAVRMPNRDGFVPDPRPDVPPPTP